RKIDELREIADRYYHRASAYVDSDSVKALFFGNKTIAYSIYDMQLKETVNLLRKNLRTLERLKPLFLALEFIIVFAAVFFYFQTRKYENVVARSLGVSRIKILVISVIEVLIIALCGEILYSGFNRGHSVIMMIAIIIECMLASCISVYINTGKSAYQSIRAKESS
ncbi:MAG: hypothetical protein Q4A41_05795, partial [Bacillota bacterium]|nr:hypothetical protein [Bacillota bacterium]